MRKKFVAIYALAGALVASPVFTSCVDDTVSPQVEAQREANIKYKNALAAQAEASAAVSQANAANTQAMSVLNQEAKRLENEATEAYNAYQAAIREYDLAEKEYQASLREYNQALKEKKDAIELERLQAVVEQAKINIEQTKAYVEQQKISNESSQLTNEIDKAKLELEIEAAKIEAEAAILTQKGALLEQQEALNKTLQTLDNKAKEEANKLSNNAMAIMVGGTYYTGSFNADGEENTITYKSAIDGSGDANSIIALMGAIATENANLLKYNADMVTINEYIRTQTNLENKNIAAAEAKIKLYNDLKTAGTYDAMKKAYDEAETKAESYDKQIIEKGTAAYNAEKAITDYESAELAKIGTEEENGIIAYLKKIGVYRLPKYMTAVPFIGAETEDDETDDSEEVYYVYTEDDAKELADDIAAYDGEEGKIAEAKKNVDDLKAEIENQKQKNARDIELKERDLAVENAKLVPLQKEYDDILASEGYKAALKELEDKVVAAKKEFAEKPTSFERQKEDAEGNPVFDQTTGEPVMEYGTKELLEKAESKLKNFDYQYAGAATKDDATDDKFLSELKEDLDDQKDIVQPIVEAIEGLAMTEEDFEQAAMDEMGINETLAELEAVVVEEEKAKKDLEDMQAMFAPESEAMVAYTAYVEGLAELVEAKAAVAEEIAALGIEMQYWNGVKGDLADYITEGEVTKLPEYAELIANQENEIAKAKANIAKLEAADVDSTTDGSQDKISIENIIMQTEIKLAAYEAELEKNQAMYDETIAELEALLEAETEVTE